MAMNASQPRRKKRCLDDLGGPLPIPISSLTGLPAGAGNWSHFSGALKNGTVLVEDSSQGDALWHNGFFGSGSLSSCGLNYKESCDIVNEPRYERKLEWNKLANGTPNSAPNKDEDCLILYENDKTIICMKKCEQEEMPHGEELSDPYPLSEHLILTLEEAFFLSYALGSLVVTSEAGVRMDIDTMWLKFSQIHSKFPLQYAVYHHFRCKGWVVKPGLKFGADWILYRMGPPFYHAEYLVWVDCLWKDNLKVDQRLSSRRSSIEDISALERLANHVAKSVLLCHVLRPRNLVDRKLKDVSCLKEFEISESCIQRWTPTIEEKSKNHHLKTS